MARLLTRWKEQGMCPVVPSGLSDMVHKHFAPLRVQQAAIAGGEFRAADYETGVRGPRTGLAGEMATRASAPVNASVPESAAPLRRKRNARLRQRCRVGASRPALETPHGPERRRSIAGATGVFIDPAREQLAVEQRGHRRIRRQHVVAEPLAVRTADPLADRRREPALRQACKRRGQAAARRARAAGTSTGRAASCGRPECGTRARSRGDRAAGSALRGCWPCSCDPPSRADRSAGTPSGRRTARAGPRSSRGIARYGAVTAS